MPTEGLRGPGQRLRVVTVMPVFRDWECAALVCDGLDRELAGHPEIEMEALLVDDGSPHPLEGWNAESFRELSAVRALLLRRNLGHQQAIAVALCYVHDHIGCDWVLVMDADGEDRPEAAIMLARRANECGERIIFAERGRRFEGLIFKTGYVLFRVFHRILTGIPVRVGNFSIVPIRHLDRLVCMSELWNHYAGAIFKSKLPFDCVAVDRGHRLRGESQMNLVSLVAHGLAGIASFSDAVATRILLFNLVSMAGLIVVMVAVVAIRFGTDRAVPGWATYTAGLLLVLLIQLAAISFSMVFSLIASRAEMKTIPARDYHVFTKKEETLWIRE